MMVELIVGYLLGAVACHFMNETYGLNRSVPRHLITFWLVLWPAHVTALLWLFIYDEWLSGPYGATADELDERWPAKLEEWFDAMWRK